SRAAGDRGYRAAFPTRRSSDLLGELAVGRDVVGPVEPDGVDLALLDELHEVERLPGLELQLVDLLGLEQHVAALAEVEALDDLRSEEHTSELQSRENLVCRLLL